MRVLDASKTKPLEGGATYSVANRVMRAIWIVVWLLFARWTPPPLHGWRRLVLRAFGARIAKGARVHASVKVWLPSNLELGSHVLIGPGVWLYNPDYIKIGALTVISQRSHICSATHDVNDPNFQTVIRPITIGENCWIASEAFVGPGVTMADRSVLSARGVLFRDTELEGIYQGNPAVKIKQRKLREV
jgi:putative colanic acid biosynthesis acetyltransferase WcaF